MGNPNHIKGVNLKHLATVHYGKPKITYVRGHKLANLGSGNLLYNGGPVQQDPEVYVLFWGSWWASGCSNQQGFGSADETYLYNFLHGVGSTSDAQSGVDSQYYGPAGTYPLFPTVAGHVFTAWYADCTDPPQSATDQQLADEAASFESTLQGAGYTINGNSQLVIVSPSGTNPGGGFGSTYCAWHSYYTDAASQNVSFTNLPYIPDQGSNCGANYIQNGDDGWSIVEGHEFNESTTDPVINAWIDSSGYEIGDKCAWTGIYVERMSTGSFAMQPEWNNRSASCKTGWTYPRGQIKLSSNTTLCWSSGAASGTTVTLHACDTTTSREWTKPSDNSVRRTGNSGMCLKSASTANGAALVTVRCDETTSQQWPYKATTGHWWNKASGKCAQATSAVAGAVLELEPCSTTNTLQQFSNL